MHKTHGRGHGKQEFVIPNPYLSLATANHLLRRRRGHGKQEFVIPNPYLSLATAKKVNRRRRRRRRVIYRRHTSRAVLVMTTMRAMYQLV